MIQSFIIAKKELQLLIRDKLTATVLFALPFAMILILGLLLGEGFGQKSDDLMRISVLNLDKGLGLNNKSWAEHAIDDIVSTPNIKVEIIQGKELADELVKTGKRAAVIIFNPDFSERVNECSFLSKGVNPFHRDGIYLEKLQVSIIKDNKQPATSAIIESVCQIALLRIVMPWMIGKAFEKLGDPEFIELLGKEVSLPIPPSLRLLIPKDKIPLGELLELASGKDIDLAKNYREKVGVGIQTALTGQFKNYNLTGKSWASLTRSINNPETVKTLTTFQNEDGTGILKRGAIRYQILVPSFTVMFAFSLILISGWIFVAEKRQGTFNRLLSTPVRTSSILMGKFLPTIIISLLQIFFLLGLGKLLLGLKIGLSTWSLTDWMIALIILPFATSFCVAASSLFIGILSKNETQLALLSSVPVCLFALIGGCIFPWEMMPDNAKTLAFLTPQGWALDAFREIMPSSFDTTTDFQLIWKSSLVLSIMGFILLSITWVTLGKIRFGNS
ncbi:MAG: ABC transporter permease [Planctomycetes bacterium]|nr:ABC transporter permease [Planctomycetota bacterium]